MNYFDWDKSKNTVLIKERNISFQEIKIAVQNHMILDDYNHPNQKNYPGQRIMAVEVSNYVYLVPYVKDGEKIFLKTIIPSRKATKKYLERRKL